MTPLQSAVADAGFTKGGGGGGAPRAPKAPAVYRPIYAAGGGVQIRGGGVQIRGGGGRRCKHWPPGAGDPRYVTA